MGVRTFLSRGFVFRLDRKLRSLCFEIGARSIKTRQENSKHLKISDAGGRREDLGTLGSAG